MGSGEIKEGSEAGNAGMNNQTVNQVDDLLGIPKQ